MSRKDVSMAMSWPQAWTEKSGLTRETRHVRKPCFILMFSSDELIRPGFLHYNEISICLPSHQSLSLGGHIVHLMCAFYIYLMYWWVGIESCEEKLRVAEDLPAGWSLIVFSPLLGGGASVLPCDWICGCSIYGEHEWGHLSPAFTFWEGKKGRISRGVPGNRCFLLLLGSWDWKNVSRGELKLAAGEIGNYKRVQLLTPAAHRTPDGLVWNCVMFRPNSHTNRHHCSEDTYIEILCTKMYFPGVQVKILIKK